MSDNEELIFRKLSLRYNLSEQIIKEICHSQFEFTSKTIKEMDLKNKTDEEIKNLKTNFRFRMLGSLYVSDKLLYNRKIIEKIKQDKKNGDND
jgi:hypothetical protein